MRRFHIYIGFIVWLLTSLFAVSCNDELEGNGYSFNSSSNLQVLVPLVHSNGTRAGESDPAENLTYNATEEECRINSLRLFAFPIDGKGTLLNEYLGAPGTSFYEPGNFEGGVDVATYTLRIDPGTYRIYVVANMEDVLDVLKDQKTIDTEDKLKKVVLNYLPEGKPGMPACGNIPMIYEPIKDTNITGDSKTTDIVANLKFTCVKIKLNLLFDPADSEMQEALKTNGLKINDITANNLSQSTSLVWGGKFYASDKEDVSGIIGPKIMYKQSSEASAAGSFFSNWTRDDTNKNKSNADVITAVGTAAAAPSIIKDKWLFQGTYYLPERYIKTNDQQSFLTLSSMIGANDNSYNIPLGHTDNPEKPRTFPRGTYYEIIGNLKTIGNITLDCQVHVKDWEPAELDADFSHTTLWVNKTSAQITSIEEDSISYKSNWVNVEFGCDEIVDGKPLVVADKKVNHIITFRINPEIPMSAYGDGEGKFPPKGKTKIWLKANNLKKYLDVDYNVEPLFEVDPLEVIIYYEASAKTNTKVFTWVTNLGGIVLPDKLTSTIGNSTIKISKTSDENAPKGTFQVEATTDPVTTTVHTFRVHSKDLYNSNYKYRNIKVTVRPPVGDYRIYFRAINDRSSNNGQFGTNQFQGILDEYYGTGDNNNNWNDSWSSDNGIQTSRHNVYIYSQKGETTGTAIPKENVWYFNNRYNNPSNQNGMTGDTNNPGWYYKDMDFDAKGYRLDKGDGQETTPIKPGETLMIFYSFNNDGADLHRCPHHMAPGIPLFNYEDREGWILYDPTTDPYYRIFDEKPIVKDINYVVYTKNKVLGWAFRFGVATNNPTSSGSNSQYTHWDNTWDYHSANSFKSEQVSGGWWKTTIRLKAVDGYHEKGIVLQFEKDGYDEKYTLFRGRSYEKYNDTGYYDNNSWHPGIPSGV